MRELPNLFPEHFTLSGGGGEDAVTEVTWWVAFLIADPTTVLELAPRAGTVGVEFVFFL